MPPSLEPGVLYVSTKYGTAAHLCACGCGEKVRTPLGPTEWAVTETPGGPTLSKSVGNWQKPCRSHYLIIGGEVRWAGDWIEAEVAAGRKDEQMRRERFYAARRRRFSLWRWLKGLFR